MSGTERRRRLRDAVCLANNRGVFAGQSVSIGQLPDRSAQPVNTLPYDQHVLTTKTDHAELKRHDTRRRTRAAAIICQALSPASQWEALAWAPSMRCLRAPAARSAGASSQTHKSAAAPGCNAAGLRGRAPQTRLPRLGTMGAVGGLGSAGAAGAPTPSRPQNCRVGLSPLPSRTPLEQSLLAVGPTRMSTRGTSADFGAQLGCDRADSAASVEFGCGVCPPPSEFQPNSAANSVCPARLGSPNSAH